MAKCGGCGKFLSNTNNMRCCKCQLLFHKACVNIPDSAGIKSLWICPDCKIKIPREDNSATPIKLTETSYSVDTALAQMHDQSVASPHHQHTIPAGSTEATLTLEIRALRTELSEMRAEVRLCRSEIADCRVDVAEFKEALTTCNDKITGMEVRISSLETRFEGMIPDGADRLEDTIANLKNQLNQRDQELLANDVELSGLPEQKGENLMHNLKTMCIKLGIELDSKDIVHVERVGPVRRNLTENTITTTPADPSSRRPRGIAVRFARRATRDQWLAAARVRRVLTTKDIEMPGPTTRVYINERLTRANRHLFFLARQAGSHHHWKFVWTRNGNILARKAEGERAVHIRSERDLTTIFGSHSV